MARILVAEDEEGVREFVRRALSHQGHEVTAVNDGTRALEALGAGQYDLLLTDIVMPGMDGIALALKVSKDHPELPILLMSAYPGQRERAHNLDALVHRVISKPFSLEEICAAAEDTLAGAAAGAADQASS